MKCCVDRITCLHLKSSRNPSVRNCTEEEKGSLEGSSFSLLTISTTTVFFVSKESRLVDPMELMGFSMDQEALFFCFSRADPGSRFLPSLLPDPCIASSPLSLSLSSFSDSECINFFALADMKRPRKRVPLFRWSCGDVFEPSFTLIPVCGQCSIDSVIVVI